MRSWQPVIGVLLGFLFGKYLSMAIFWLPGIFILAGNLNGGISFKMALLSIVTLVVTFAVAGAIWLFVNFFILSSWLPKAAGACALMSAVMMIYTAGVILFCDTLGWFKAICAPPFWVTGWF